MRIKDSSWIWAPLLLVGAWQTAASLGWLDALFFPAPAHLVKTAWAVLGSGEMERHLAATVSRLLAAFVIGSGLGIPTGLLVGTFSFWRRSLQSVFTGLSATPKLALLPAFILLFGLNEGSRLLPAAIGCFILTAVSAMDAARNVDRGYLDLARIYGARRFALFFRVYLPACLPNLFTGMRLGLANALVMVIATEFLFSTSGVGAFIWIAAQTLAFDRMYVGIGFCTMLGILTNLLFGVIEDRAAPERAMSEARDPHRAGHTHLGLSPGLETRLIPARSQTR